MTSPATAAQPENRTVLYATVHAELVSRNGDRWTVDDTNRMLAQWAADGRIVLRLAISGKPVPADAFRTAQGVAWPKHARAGARIEWMVGLPQESRPGNRYALVIGDDAVAAIDQDYPLQVPARFEAQATTGIQYGAADDMTPTDYLRAGLALHLLARDEGLLHSHGAAKVEPLVEMLVKEAQLLGFEAGAGLSKTQLKAFVTESLKPFNKARMELTPGEKATPQAD